MNDLWNSFLRWAPTYQLVIVCAKCGSTYVDAGLPSTQMICRACKTTTHFDDERFAGLRVQFPYEKLSEDQKKAMLQLLAEDFHHLQNRLALKEKDQREGDLHHDLLKALNDFLSEFSKISPELQIKSESREKLFYEWESLKARVDIILQQMKKG